MLSGAKKFSFDYVTITTAFTHMKTSFFCFSQNINKQEL